MTIGGIFDLDQKLVTVKRLEHELSSMNTFDADEIQKRGKELHEANKQIKSHMVLEECLSNI